MRPKLAFIPNRPLNAAGMRVDPPPSLAVAIGTIPAATAAAEPPLDPPGVTAGSQGLRVVPHARVEVKHTEPNSGDAVLPTTTAPACRRRATSSSSRVTAGLSLKSRDPFDVGSPAPSRRSLTPIGTPAS